jgi:hypothetical protein
MWLKARKMNALLAPLGPVIGGQVSGGTLSGSYGGYAVEVQLHSGYPIKYLSSAPYGSVSPEDVNMLRVTLAGVAGSQSWHCQSSASGALHDIVSRFTAGQALKRFKPGEFKFEGADRLNDWGERMGEQLVRRLGMAVTANAGPALQQRLIAAGLFGELDELRWGGHPYLPKAQFIPGGRELAKQANMDALLARARPAVEERLRAAGVADYQSLVEAKMHEAEDSLAGRLTLEVEAGKARVPPPERFRGLLEHAARIAQINAAVNQA